MDLVYKSVPLKKNLQVAIIDLSCIRNIHIHPLLVKHVLDDLGLLWRCTEAFLSFQINQAVSAVVINDRIKDKTLAVLHILELHWVEILPCHIHRCCKAVGVPKVANVLFFNNILKSHPDTQIKYVAFWGAEALVHTDNTVILFEIGNIFPRSPFFRGLQHYSSKGRYSPQAEPNHTFHGRP